MYHAMSLVAGFHEAFGIPIADKPELPGGFTNKRRNLRRRLLAEEYAEYVSAELGSDLVEIADALADMAVIICGTALEYGIPLNEVLAEVHQSNMSKLGDDGKPIYREDGKVVKGPNYFKPDIKGILENVN